MSRNGVILPSKTNALICSLAGILLLIVGAAACQPRVEVVTVESGQMSEPDQVVVTRLVMVTPEGAGPAIPGTLTPLIEERVVTVTVAVPATPVMVGAPERPVRLLFPADVPERVLNVRGETLSEALSEETGITLQIERLESYQAVVDAMCAAPADTIGLLPAMGYVLANELCDVQAGATALQSDLPWQMGMIVARADSGITSLEDLADRRWAKPALMSVTRDLYFQALMRDAGIEPAEVVEYDSENSALLAVFNGEADFATATYLPPILPYNERPWVYGEDEPEVWRRLGIAPERLPVGYIVVIADPEDGGYRIRDARASLFDVQPEIFRQTRIIGISEPIPNTSVAFGAEFPLSLARKLQEGIVAFAASEACAEALCSNDFYGWDGAAPVDDQAYNPLRFIQEHLGLTAEQLWEDLGQ